MDGHRFDRVTRSLATGSSRRRLLKGLVAGAFAAVGVGRAAEADAARCKRFGQHCNKSERCCAGKCAPRRFVCECHHYQRACITATGAETCCPRGEAAFARCCPNPAVAG